MKAPRSDQRTPPRVLLLNQSVGPLFLELTVDVARAWGPCLLCTGTPLHVADADLSVRLLPAYDRRRFLTRGLSWFRYLLRACQEIVRYEADALLVVVTNPPLLPALAWLVHLVRRQPYIVLVYDIYPDIIVGLGLLSDRHLVTRAWRWLNRQVYRYAARVVTIGRHMAQTLQQYMPGESCAPAIDVIPAWVDTERFVPCDKRSNPFAMQTGQQDKLTVLHSGNLGLSHDISLLIDAAIRLQHDRRLHFLIIGEGPSKADLMRRVQAARIANVTFLPYQPEDALPYSLAVADVAVVSIRRQVEGLMMPSKAYYAMAVGSALIGISRAPNDLAALIEESGCGVNVEPDDADGLVVALRRLASDVEYRTACQQAARKVAVERFSRTLNSRRMVDLIRSVI